VVFFLNTAYISLIDLVIRPQKHAVYFKLDQIFRTDLLRGC